MNLHKKSGNQLSLARGTARAVAIALKIFEAIIDLNGPIRSAKTPPGIDIVTRP